LKKITVNRLFMIIKFKLILSIIRLGSGIWQLNAEIY